jgi:hypothetical protein
MRYTAFVPIETIFDIKIENFPDFLRPDGDDDDSSVHASTMFNTDTRSRSQWFKETLVTPRAWELAHPNDVPMGATHLFSDYISSFVGFRVWDIQNRQHATSYLRVSSVQDPLVFSIIGGRADYVVTSATSTLANYLNTILCVIEIQSKENENLCELQMLVYLLILMNTKHLPFLVGFLVRTDGQCRAFKATRDEFGGCIFEMNDLFHVSYIATIFNNILSTMA